MPSSSLVRALALSCHPLPSVAVTALSAGLAALAHLPLGRGVLLTATVFTGQLSIGWSNDYLDAERDRAVRRSAKPVAAGAVTPRMTVVATVAEQAQPVTQPVTQPGRGLPRHRPCRMAKARRRDDPDLSARGDVDVFRHRRAGCQSVHPIVPPLAPVSACERRSVNRVYAVTQTDV